MADKYLGKKVHVYPRDHVIVHGEDGKPRGLSGCRVDALATRVHQDARDMRDPAVRASVSFTPADIAARHKANTVIHAPLGTYTPKKGDK
jgi:hypothetical protein